MGKTAAIALALALWMALPGCARHIHHHHHPAPRAVHLENEHRNPDIVVWSVRPVRHACWKHRRHWHCRR